MMRMSISNQEQPLPSFFKIMLDDTDPHLPLPPAFAKKQFSDDKFHEHAVLETEFGGKWRVEIEKVGKRFCFVNGWLEFVKDTKTEVGDFLVFWLIGKLTFKVSIFGPNACAKDLSFATPTHYKCSCNCCCRSGNSSVDLNNVMKMEEEDVDDFMMNEEHDNADERNTDKDKEKNMDEDDKYSYVDEDDIDDVKEIKESYFDWKEEWTPSFQKVLTKSHTYAMRLPKKFVDEIGLDGKEKTMILRNKEMKKWRVKIGRWTDGRYHLAYRSRFWKQNNLMEGDTCSFKYFHGEEDGKTSFIEFEVVARVARNMGR